MSDIFCDIEGVEVVVDDILIWAENDEQHDKILKSVLERARQRNLRLNKKKSQIKCDSINYIGHILTKEGVKPDPKKVKAIQCMEAPKNKEDLRRFLGMLTYLSKFVPNLSQSSDPLRILLEKDAEWRWESEHAECYNRLKNQVTEAPVLQYFNTTEPLTISVDASSKGLGAVLL